MTDPADPDVIEVLSGVSAFTGEGFVTVRWGSQAGQFTPAAARAHALHVLSCAEAAENDAITHRLLREVVGLDQHTATRFLVAIRDLRPPAP